MHSHARVMHACMKRNRGRMRCIFARYEEYAACMCVHGGGAYMPASNRVAFLRAHSENVKRGFAGRSLRIWLKILRRNAWLILHHRIKSPNSREVPSDAAGRPHGGGMFVSNKTNGSTPTTNTAVLVGAPTDCSKTPTHGYLIRVVAPPPYRYPRAAYGFHTENAQKSRCF